MLKLCHNMILFSYSNEFSHKNCQEIKIQKNTNKEILSFLISKFIIVILTNNTFWPLSNDIIKFKITVVKALLFPVKMDLSRSYINRFLKTIKLNIDQFLNLIWKNIVLKLSNGTFLSWKHSKFKKLYFFINLMNTSLNCCRFYCIINPPLF